MKATLKFDLSDPEERKEHLRCTSSTIMAIALWEIHHNLRRRLEMLIPDEQIDKVIEEINDIIDFDVDLLIS